MRKVAGRSFPGRARGVKNFVTYVICPVPESVKKLERQSRVRSIGMSTNITVRGGNEQTEIPSDGLAQCVLGKRFADAVRCHWWNENNLPGNWM